MYFSASYLKTIASISLAGGIMAFASLYLTMASSNFNMEIFQNPRLVLGATNLHADLLKWSMIAGMLGNYLLLAPVVIYYYLYFKNKNRGCYFVSFCGISFALAGSIGASILAIILPSAINEYSIAKVAQQEIILRSFEFASQTLYGGLWNSIEMLLAATFWLGTGMFIARQSKLFGILTITLGALCLLDGVGKIAANHSLSAIGLNIYLVLSVIWKILFAIRLFDLAILSELRHTGKKHAVVQPLELAS